MSPATRDDGPLHTPHTLSLDDAREAFALPPEVLYLDSAAQGPRLKRVLQAAHAAIADSCAPWRLTFAQWQQRIETLRVLAATTLLDGDADALAMVPSAAYGLATIAANLPLHAGDAVLVLDGQFPSNLLVWQERCRACGAQVVAATPRAGQSWTEAVLETLSQHPRVRIAALPNAYWLDGALLDLDAIAAQLQALGAALVLDLSQSLGVLSVALARWRPAAVVSVGHKWLLGGTGLAWLWTAHEWRERGVPLEHHWTARAADDWRFETAAPPALRAGARRFDAGGVSDPLRLAMAQAALEQLARWGVANVSARLGALSSAFDATVAAEGANAWLHSTTPADSRPAGTHAPHITALRPPAAAAAAIAAEFTQAGIVCTLRRGVLRIAPHLHLSEDDMRYVALVAVRAGRACMR